MFVSHLLPNQVHNLSHTLALFEMLIRNTPPLVPTDLQDDMQHAYDHLAHNVHLTGEELDNTIIVFGKKIWPFRQAFAEFYAEHEGLLSEKFLLERLSAPLKKRYREFLVYGGTYSDLESGQPALFFSSEERHELGVVLVEVARDVYSHTVQSVLSTEKIQYEKRIQEFTVLLADIEEHLQSLLKTADAEQEHPELAAEIRAQVKSFEYGLALLGPPHAYESMRQAQEHFSGRRAEKYMRA